MLQRRRSDSSAEARSELDPVAIDAIGRSLDADALLGSEAGLMGGIQSLSYNLTGHSVDAIGHFQPGSDRASSLDMRATYAAGKPMAKKRPGDASPTGIHLVLDLPERAEFLEGNDSYAHLASYMLGVTARIAEVSDNAALFVYGTRAANLNGTLYEGPARDAYMATSSTVLDPEASRSTAELLTLASHQAETGNDALIVYSDFVDQYDPENDTFAWEQPLHALSDALPGMVWVNRVTSPSHERMPVGVLHGVDLGTIAKMNADYSEQARAKQSRINTVLDTSGANVLQSSLTEMMGAQAAIEWLTGLEL